MRNEKKLLRSVLDRFIVLSDEAFQSFYNVCRSEKYDKHDILLAIGQVNTSILFVVEGVLSLRENQDGSLRHHNFYLESEFAFEPHSLTHQASSDKEIVAVENSHVLTIPREELMKLYDQEPVFERLGRKLLEHLFAEQHRFTGVLQSMSPAERYAYIEKEKPQLLQQVTLTQLASYLGIARETLSRIRSKR